MQKPNAAMRYAAVFVAISAVLHVLAAVLAGFAWDGLKLLPFAAIYAVLGLGLAQGLRWVAWATFLMMLVFSVPALMMAYQDFPAVPRWNMLLIVLADWLTALSLIAALWNGKPDAAA